MTVRTRLDLTPAERMAVWRQRREDGTATLPPPGNGFHRQQQTCPDCGRTEIGGYYCSGCLLPIYPEDWHAEAPPAARERVERDETPVAE